MDAGVQAIHASPKSLALYAHMVLKKPSDVKWYWSIMDHTLETGVSLLRWVEDTGNADIMVKAQMRRGA
jgi:hypothetical protein